MNLTDDYHDSFGNCTDNEKEDTKKIQKYLLLSIQANIIVLSLIGLVIYTMIKPFITIERKYVLKFQSGK